MNQQKSDRLEDLSSESSEDGKVLGGYIFRKRENIQADKTFANLFCGCNDDNKDSCSCNYECEVDCSCHSHRDCRHCVCVTKDEEEYQAKRRRCGCEGD